MKQTFCKTLLGAGLVLLGLTAKAQGLEGVIVEEFHTITQADADFINLDLGNSTYPIVAGSKVYRVYVDMAPNYRFLQVYSVTAGNAADFSTTTTFWNDDNFGSEFPAQTRRASTGTLFDTYITIGSTGTAGGSSPCGALGSGLAQVGVPRNSDTDGDLTSCGVFPGFNGNDGSIPGTVPAVTTNLSGLLDFSALTDAGSTFSWINDSYATLPANTGVDPTGTNRVLIGQFTTDGDFSFHINVDISDPSNQIESYYWANAEAGGTVSPFLTYPQAGSPDCLGVIGGAALPGTACDDGLATTGNDTWDADCNCIGEVIDCLGVAGGAALPGTACNDNNPLTGNDVYGANCVCAGQLIDCLGVAGGSALPGTACDDGLATTGNDVYGADCQCAGQVIDCEGVAGGSALPGTACNDNNPATGNDTWTAGCQCVGQVIDCEGVAGGSALPGSACDDGLATTGNDTWTADCQCAGLVIDCEGVAGGSALPGTACDDGNPNSTNDVYDVNCQCSGTLANDCLGVPGGTAQPGTACDDGLATTGNDTWTADCQCVGLVIDCEGVAGGSALPGAACDDSNATTVNDTWTADCQCVGTSLPLDCEGVAGGSALPGSACDDGLATTGNDTWTADCQCVGLVIDCEGVAGGAALPGTACNDNNPNTSNDVWTADCQCAGVLANDCLGVPGGTAQPGTACDDGLATTGNDTWTADCQCVGLVIDCEGVAGGSALPGAACDDSIASTVNDTWTADCQCVGTSLPLDCEGVAGGSALPGTACNDNNPSTGNDTWTADCQCVGLVIDCEGVAGGSALPGTACNDNNAGTINDTWSAGCQCVGVPTGCTENIILNITLDAFGSQNTWTLLQDGTGTVVEQGGPYSDGQATVISEELCVPQGCYRLVVSDNAGDGIAAGGYVLLVSGTNARIIDNTANFSTGSTSSISGDQAFCLPIGTDKLISSSCDKLDWVNGQYMVASPNPAVSAEWIPGGSNAVQDANSGYEFWIFDPNGSYSFRRFRSHNVSDGFGPASATRAAHMKVNNWAVSNQIPANVLMNVRVRSRVNGVNAEFGPACRMVIDPVLAACPQTQLMNIAGNPFFSCGSTRTWGNGNYVHARPVSGANRYQFRFRQPGEGFEVVRTATTYFVQLNWTVNPLVAGETYEVEVRVSKNGGVTWCTEAAVWGPVCTLTIGSINVNANTLMDDVHQGATIADELLLFPNPNRGDLLNVSLSAVEEGVNTVSVDIFDLFGKRVSARTIAVNDGMINTVLDLNGEFAAGMYLVNITAGETVYTERLVIQP